VPGIGRQTAESIAAALSAAPTTPAVNVTTGEILDGDTPSEEPT